jgi:hypothetical protein
VLQQLQVPQVLQQLRVLQVLLKLQAHKIAEVITHVDKTLI